MARPTVAGDRAKTTGMPSNGEAPGAATARSHSPAILMELQGHEDTWAQSRNLNSESILESVPEVGFITFWQSRAGTLSTSEMTQVLLESEMPSRWGEMPGELTRPHEWAEQ